MAGRSRSGRWAARMRRENKNWRKIRTAVRAYNRIGRIIFREPIPSGIYGRHTIFDLDAPSSDP